MSNKPKRSLSVLKRARQNLKRSIRNRGVRTRVRTYIKKMDVAIASGDKDVISATLREVTKVISSAASKGVMHRNTASRHVSRLAKKAYAAISSAAA